jgi:hypothetical protein
MAVRAFGFLLIAIVTQSGVEGLDLKDGGLLRKLLTQRSESDKACFTDPCHDFDVTECDLECHVIYMEDSYYEVLYHGCLVQCAEDYMYCKYELDCDIP